ncbi:tetratricopeptide repeat protein [Kribbella solani]|uniref:ATP-binding protein n=1 Tax=Kribbella solani TaxID=236067 RepID=UPI0029A960E3|nr:tetratricopeptide repeat protein [Kribbella solani]MDX3000175.1 tetratricopeptide repeat protein [Kribbella solani]
MTTIGQQVKGFRQRSGLTQEELAEKAALSVRSLRDLESGRVTKPRTRSIRMIADALELTDDESRQLLALLADGTLPDPPAASQPTAAARISQLPADVSNFTGRFTALRELDELLIESTAARTTVISAIGGTGKTALAVHWAHGVAPRFPDGQLYIDLRGFDPEQEPLAPVDALGTLLSGLGVPPAEQPTTLDERSARFRSRIADLRLLVILDNAASAAQVRPLLPGSATCRTIVTSRDRLPGLIARDGAVPIQLEAMSESEAGELLRGMIGNTRVDADRPATADIIALCGRLPLAVRVVGANLALVPRQTLRTAADALAATDRLDSLSLPGDPGASVLPAFELSYRPLPDELKVLFGRLGLLPGTTFGVGVVASAMSTTADIVVPRLRHLVSLNLVQPLTEERFTMHDLVKLFARRCADGDDEPVRRALDYYLQSADAANHRLIPARVRTPVDPPMSGVVVEQFRTPESAMEWCGAELSNIADAVDLAFRAGHHRQAAQLPTAMIDYFQRYKHYSTWLATHDRGLQAARLLDDKEREGILLRDTALVYRDLRQFDRCRELLDAAASIARTHGHRLPLARALSALGVLVMELGDNESAIRYLDECARIAAEDGDRYAAMIATLNLGYAAMRTGRLDDARTAFERAIAMSSELSAPMVEASSTGALGEIYRLSGDLTSALAHFRKSFAVATRINEANGQLAAQEAVAQTLAALGRTTEARVAYRAAAELAAQLGDPREPELHAALEDLDKDGADE